MSLDLLKSDFDENELLHLEKGINEEIEFYMMMGKRDPLYIDSQINDLINILRLKEDDLGKIENQNLIKRVIGTLMGKNKKLKEVNADNLHVVQKLSLSLIITLEKENIINSESIVEINNKISDLFIGQVQIKEYLNQALKSEANHFGEIESRLGKIEEEWSFDILIERIRLLDYMDDIDWNLIMEICHIASKFHSLTDDEIFILTGNLRRKNIINSDECTFKDMLSHLWNIKNANIYATLFKEIAEPVLTYPIYRVLESSIEGKQSYEDLVNELEKDGVNLMVGLNTEEFMEHILEVFKSKTSLVESIDTPPVPEEMSVEQLEKSFFESICDGDIEKVAQLISLGVNINRIYCNDMEIIPIEQAVCHEHLDIFRLLLEHGADIDIQEGLPFLQTIKYREDYRMLLGTMLEVCQDKLIRHMEENPDYLPLENIDIMELLLACGINKDLGEDLRLMTLNNMDTFNKLVEAGFYADNLMESYCVGLIMNQDSYSYLAAKNIVEREKEKVNTFFPNVVDIGNIGLIKLFVNNGAKVNEVMDFGVGEFTPLLFLVFKYIQEDVEENKKELIKIMRLLIKLGADRNKEVDGITGMTSFNETIRTLGLSEIEEELAKESSAFEFIDESSVESFLDKADEIATGVNNFLDRLGNLFK